MLARMFLMFAVVVMVSACSSTEEETALDTQATTASESTTGGPLNDIYQSEELDPSGPAAGTQEDLVVNVGDRVFFATDRYDIDNEARMVLERQANWLKQYPNLSVTIEGHADERGTREYNLALGERRANSAKNYLIALGVDASRIDVITYGKERPAVAGANEAAWAQNRRAVTKLN